MDAGAGARLKREAVLNLAAAVVGTLGALGAYVFRSGVALVQNLLFHGEVSPLEVAPVPHGLGPLVVVLPLLGMGLAMAVLYGLTRSTRGAGATTVIEAASMRGGSLSVRDSLAKALAAVATLGAGGSAGREGPIVQIGGAGGSAIGEALGLGRKDRRILIAAGAAGGIAATFNAPVAAVVFTIEAIFLEFRTESFVPMVVASVLGTSVGRILFGADATFALDPARFGPMALPELGLVVPMAIGAGLLSVFFLGLSEWGDDAFDGMEAWKRPLVGGLAMGAVGLALPQMLGVGYDSMQAVLDGALQPVPALFGSLALTFLVLMLVKPIAVTLTLGGGGSGGVFSPTLFVGIMFGALAGLAFGRVLPDLASPYWVWAVLGMVAVFAAVSRATLTGIILAVEFTHTFDLIVPAMLAGVVADVVSWAFHREGLYATRLAERGIHLPTDLSPNVLDMVLIEEVMTTDVETLTEDTTVKEALQRMMRTGHGGYPVLDAEGHLTGVVTRTDLRERTDDVPMEAPITEIMSTDVLVALPDETVHAVFDRLVLNDIGHIPVVDPEEPWRVVGWVTKTDAMRAEVADADVAEGPRRGHPPVD